MPEHNPRAPLSGLRVSALRYLGTRWEPIDPVTSPPEQPTWVDYELSDRREAEDLLAAEWLRGVFPQLDASRAARGGNFPPADPPRIRTFATWSFTRAYWLGSASDRSLAALLTQEIHVLAADKLVMSLRYPVMHWHSVMGEIGEFPSGPEMMSVEAICRYVTDIAQTCGDEPHFGTLLLTTMLSRMASSHHQALDVVGMFADDLEVRVSGPDREDVSLEILRLRRAIRQVRWAFLPKDESDELLMWPAGCGRDAALDARIADIGAESERAIATKDDLMEQVQQTFDLQVLQRQEAIERATFSLTVVAALVLPPTLIAGIYGMNFDVSPVVSGRMPILLMVVSMAASWALLRRLDPRQARSQGKRSGRQVRG